MLTISRAPALICSTPFKVSERDVKYAPAVISLVLYYRNSTFIEEFSTKNACGRSSIQRYLNFPIDLTKSLA